MRAIRRVFLSDLSPAGGVMLHTDTKAFWTHALPLLGESATNLSGAIQGVTGNGGATTEAGLLESQRQLLALIDNLPGIASRCSIEPPSIPSFISGGCEALTGYTAEELIGRTMAGFKLTHPEDLDAASAEIRAAVRAGRPYVTNYRIIQRDGSIRWVTESGRAIYVAGKPVHLESFMSDFTDPKRAQAELRDAEAKAQSTAERLAAVLEGTMDCVAALDREWRITFINRRAMQETGLGPDALGKSLWDAFPAIKDTGFRAACERAMTSGAAVTSTGYFAPLDRWYEVEFTPIEDAVTVFFRDISERRRAELAVKASENRLQTILDSVPQIVWSARPDGQRYFNKQWYEFTGVEVATSENLGAWVNLIHPDDRERVAAAQREREVTGQYDVEYRLRHHSGEYLWVLTQGRPTRDADGNILCWYGSCIEINDRVLAEEALSANEKRFGTILDSMPQMVWTNSADGTQTFYNRQWYEFTGFARGSLQSVRRVDLVHPEDADRAMALWNHSLATGEAYEAEYRLRHSSGEYRWVLSRALLQGTDRSDVTWYGTTIDIHERVLARAALRDSEALNRSIIDASADCISMLDLEGKILFLNDVAQREMAAENSADLLGTPWLKTFPVRSRSIAGRELVAARRNGNGHFTALRPSTSAIPKWWDVVVTPVVGEDGEPASLVAISRDVTHQKTAQERIQWAAMHDPLTNLPNRALFQQWLDEALAGAGGSGAQVGLLLLDLDDFKQVNDGLGHDAGDKLLCTLAERLQSVTNDGDLVARLGGDEFAMVLSSVGGEEDIIAAAERILTRLKEPYIYDGRLLDCRATIGASVYPHHGLHRTELLKQADVALYTAKSSGRGRMKIFEPAMRAKMQNRTSMLSLAREAIRCDLIEPFYQPKIDLRTGKVAGFEALLRWRHEHRGMQPPSTIAAAFEDADLACAISDQMIDRAVADMRRWLDQGVDFGHVAVNASAAEFRSGDFADRLLRRLARASVPTSRFQLEVTETVFLGRGAEYVEQALKQLSAAGVQIALDDFGTGYASLTHLKQFPVDVIKVDRSFVGDLESDADAAPIIRAVINLGQSLDIKIVAEGIETEAQHQFLVAQGCDYGQGYLYGKAAPASQVPTSRSLYRLPRPKPSPPKSARRS